jgi:hypothetical protein
MVALKSDDENVAWPIFVSEDHYLVISKFRCGERQGENTSTTGAPS